MPTEWKWLLKYRQIYEEKCDQHFTKIFTITEMFSDTILCDSSQNKIAFLFILIL